MLTNKYSLHVSGLKMAIYKKMLQNVASKSFYASDDRENPHQTPQMWRLWLYEKKSKSCGYACHYCIWSSCGLAPLIL